MAQHTRINVTYSFLSRCMISSLLSSCIRKFNTSGWFWKINKRNQLKHISHWLANIWMFWRHIQQRERKIHFLLGTILRSQVEETRSTRTRVWKMYCHRSMIQMWPVPLSFGHIPLRSFLTLPPPTVNSFLSFLVSIKGTFTSPTAHVRNVKSGLKPSPSPAPLNP